MLSTDITGMIDRLVIKISKKEVSQKQNQRNRFAPVDEKFNSNETDWSLAAYRQIEYLKDLVHDFLLNGKATIVVNEKNSTYPIYDSGQEYYDCTGHSYPFDYIEFLKNTEHYLTSWTVPTTFQSSVNLWLLSEHNPIKVEPFRITGEHLAKIDQAVTKHMFAIVASNTNYSVRDILNQVEKLKALLQSKEPVFTVVRNGHAIFNGTCTTYHSMGDDHYIDAEKFINNLDFFVHRWFFPTLKNELVDLWLI